MASLALSACLSTKVSSLAPNMVRVNLQGADAPSDEQALKEALVLASKETLAHEYDLFRFIDWSAGPAQLATPGQPAVANFAVTVVMFRYGEQGSNPVFDARAVLKTQEPQQ
ncbi:hypothetical protein ACNHKD_10010 [Methylocystis sp. JAN1]|uniref:hypothetical protein n=1 Tax=Methylocystis sp. JAN1 TaxID=3397211 RepID=UPI003FA28307